jgi:molybdopterin biosynthesis enzyme
VTKEQAFARVLAELERAQGLFPPFHSAHEGYAVLLEEVDELKETVFKKGFTSADQCQEAQQVAAMALRFLVDLTEVPDDL